MAKYVNSTNPIKPVGMGNHVVQTYPMTRYIDYTERDWRIASDRLINNGQGQMWDTIVTWMLSSSSFVQTLVERRLTPILSTRFVLVDKDGEVDEELTESINKRWFKSWIESAAMAIFQGYSAGVFDPKMNKTERYPIAVIDPFNRALKHNPFELNGQERFADYSNLFYVQYSSQHQTMLGLFQPLVKEYIGISITLRNWLASGTRQAFPMTQVGYKSAVVTNQVTNEQDEEELQQVNQNKATAEYIADNIDPTVAIVTPFSIDDKGNQVYDVDVRQTEHHSSDNAYKTYADYINEAEIRMINLVLGSQLTMKEGTSRALGEVHERVSKTYAERDVEWMLDILNNELKPKLNIPEDHYFSQDSTTALTLDDAQKLSTIVNENGKQLTQDFFTQIGLPDNFYEDKVGLPVPPVAVKDNDTDEDIDTEEKHEKNFIVRAFEYLTGKGHQSKKTEPEGIVYLKAPSLKDQVSDEDVTLPSSAPRTYLADSVIRKMYDSEQPNQVFIQQDNYKYYADIFKASLYGDDPLGKLSAFDAAGIPNAKMPTYLANIFQFSAAKNVAEQAAVNQQIADALFDSKGTKVSFNEFKKSVNNVVKVFREDWLKTEYRTAGMAAVMAKNWETIDKSKDVFPYWRYRTQEDARVRESHARLDGKVFRVDDENSKKIYPPNGWNCRCYTEQLMASEVGEGETRVATSDEVQDYLNNDVSMGFKFNAADSGIMPNKDHDYFQVLPSVNRLNYEKYMLDQTAKIMETAPKVEVSQATSTDISKMLKRAATKDGDLIVENGTSKVGFRISQQLRSKIEIGGGKGANLLGETIANPDEMWVQWVDERSQKKVKGTMLRIANNVVYAVEFVGDVVTDAYIVRTAAQADMLRTGMLFLR